MSKKAHLAVLAREIPVLIEAAKKLGNPAIVALLEKAHNEVAGKMGAGPEKLTDATPIEADTPSEVHSLNRSSGR